ncbi:Retrotransposon gag domain [Arabidopsis thaliana x Arabidopsis arenosa]|uniref:Retrotransposon gag domain n=1 Tax=Arabidopsis thaliana x Arabidopsis arenosa TaxID=1240361 RepID=A0A8T2AYH3_9BRAS|nr:Retrotransposon gag domain [Arabidopsis thaliana x Arabidopsis arenosa]
MASPMNSLWIISTSWLKQLKPGSLTNWQSIKIAFLNNFYGDGKFEELRNKLSTFTQGPAEAFKAAWVRFKEYQRDCPHHGFSEVQLIGTFFRGIDWRYQMALDAASNGNFNTRYPIDAVALIENLACSNSTKNADFERKKIAGAITGTQFAKVNAKLDSVHSLLTGKKAVHFAAEVETIEPEEESEEGVFYIDGQGNFSGNFSGQRFTGNQSNSGFNNRSTFQKTYPHTSSFKRTYGNTIYQNPPAPTPESKMETMLEQILEGQTKLTLDVQVAQTFDAVKRQDGVLPGRVGYGRRARARSSRAGVERHSLVSLDTRPLPVENDGVVRHHQSLQEISTFDGELSTATVSPTSTPSTSVDRHSPSVDRHWVRTAPYALVFPPTKPVYTPLVPFPRKRRSKQEIQDARCKAIMEKILTSIPKVNPETSSPTLDRYVKRLVNNGICAEEAVLLTKDISLIMLQEAKKERKKRVVVSEHVSSIIQTRMPEKLPDPESFVLDCSISTSRFKKSLCDLGSSINLMPHSVAVRLGMISYRPTRITLLLADRSKRIPEGILEDVPVKIGECLIPADFVVLDYDVQPKDPLILGRAFLATAGATIDVKKGQILLDVCDVKMNFYIKGPRTPPILRHGTTDVAASTSFLGHEHTSTTYTPPWLARRRASEKSSNTSPAPPHS